MDIAIPSPAPRFALLADFAGETSSEGRRQLLRTVTDGLLHPSRGGTDADHAAFDEILSAVASDFSIQVRIEIARLIAGSLAPLSHTARRFALDEIEVAAPVLKHSRSLTEADLLDVIAQKSQDHLLAVTGRGDIGPNVSHALVEHGGDPVVAALLENKDARIADATYEAVGVRAQESTILQAPFVRRKGVPPNLLNDIYLKVEPKLRGEILQKFEHLSAEELDTAFKRSRSRLSQAYRAVPDDFEAARQRIDTVQKRGELAPRLLIALLREGKSTRTAFKLAFGRLAGVNFELVDRVVEERDVDAIALLCRGAGFERAIFVTLAIIFDDPDRRMSGAEDFGKLYESVPLHAAQRALRFWKARASGND
ncbi:MAG TPA: DUF2336 domain-containing protein [Rhizomicrobium sp.]